MPTVAQILQRATDYEEKAKALRIAAAELNGHAMDSAVKQMPERIKKALKLRAATRPAPEPEPEHRHAPPPNGTTAAIVAVLRRAGRPMVFAELRKQIRGLSPQAVGSALRMGHLQAHGPKGKYRTWSIAGPKPKSTKRGRPARSVALLRPTKPGELGTLITAILRDQGEPMTVAELGLQARARGRRKGLTGLVNYVKRGTLVQYAPDATHPKRRYGLPA